VGPHYIQSIVLYAAYSLYIAYNLMRPPFSIRSAYSVCCGAPQPPSRGEAWRPTLSSCCSKLTACWGHVKGTCVLPNHSANMSEPDNDVERGPEKGAKLQTPAGAKTAKHPRVLLGRLKTNMDSSDLL